MALVIIMFLSLFASMPMTAYAQPPEYVCMIVESGIEYATLSDALSVVADGQTIKLFTDITYSNSITADNKSISIDLNGYNLTVDNVVGHALQAMNNGMLNISDLVGDGTLTVNSAGEYKHCANAVLGGDINITGNLTASIPVGAMSYQNIIGAYADGAGSSININGSATGYMAGVYAQNGAVITVTGNVSGSYYGAFAAYGGLVDITGDVNAGTNGLTVEYGGLAEIEGDITGGTAIYVMNGTGWDAPYASINGNVVSTGTCAINVGDSSDIEITGNVTGCITASGSTTTSPAITVNGDLKVTSGYGVSIYYGGTVTVNGAIIGASPYLYLNNINILADDYEISGNYYVYSNTTYDEHYPPYSPNTVKVKIVELPTVDNVNIEGNTTVGSTLTGSYDFIAGSYSEGDTSFRWLRVSGTPSLLGEAFLLYTTNNVGGVTSDAGGPPNPATFTVTDTSLITKISNYHYNSYETPGTISLQDSSGAVYGPWDAVLDGYWRVYPDITVPAGTYTVIDSKPASWSFNSESSNAGMTEIVGYTIITGATEPDYQLQNNDSGKSIMFEVTVRDTYGNAGSPVLTSPVGPVSMPPENQAPVLSSNWNYSTVYFGQHYPFTISVTDYENSPNTRLYSFIDSAVPSQSYNFTVVPGTVNITLSPIEGILSTGSHTLNYYATDAGGATSSVLVLPFTIVSNISNNASLSSISISGINLTPVFNAETMNYTANVSNSINSAAITAEPSDSSATVTISGAEGTTKNVVLSVGSNIVEIVVTAADGITTKTYTLSIERARSSSNGSTIEPAIIVTTEESGKTTKNSTDIDAEISSGTASASVTKAIVNALLDKSDATDGNSKEDLIKIIVDTPKDIDKLQINIPQSELDKIASETDANFGIESSFISIEFDEKAIETISNASNEGNVVITAEQLDDLNGRPVFDITVKNDGKSVSDFHGGHATVTVPYILKQGENPNAVVVYYLTDDGTLQTVRGHYDDAKKAVVFKTTHFTKFMIGYNQINFDDVPANAWYKNAVDFIAAREITSGTAVNQFSPDTKLTRGQFVVLLMNAYEISPERNNEFDHISNFNDSGDNYYTDYLLVAKGLGIVNGIGNNLFAPEKEITRQEMFVILHNALKVIDEVPVASTDKQLSEFNDDAEIADWAEEALSTLVKASIVSGNNNSLNPTAKTTRAEIAQVFYNLLSK
ncbi:S-layer homology domain-containing protein [Sedimentibacter saalensis]|uniref:S-layer homology domain-containing protein n=1 Tax=Sedimentibacter saalensis TaxID=130788 RepID=UPI002B204BA2|nr:S-layer homology domain-containing protein [Sedimentibacter saalensis]